MIFFLVFFFLLAAFTFFDSEVGLSGSMSITAPSSEEFRLYFWVKPGIFGSVDGEKIHNKYWKRSL